MFTNIWHTNWIQATFPFVLTAGVVGAALAYAFAG